MLNKSLGISKLIEVAALRYLLVFYWAINVGAFFGLATSYAAVSLRPGRNLKGSSE